MRQLTKTPVVVVVVVVVMLAMAENVRAARILMAHPLGTRSHANLFMTIAEYLAQRNHTVRGALR